MAEKKINTDHNHLSVSRIRNLPDGVDPGDATNLGQVQAAIAAASGASGDLALLMSWMGL